jgi:hypothetical protein
LFDTPGGRDPAYLQVFLFGSAILISAILKIVFLKIVFLKSSLFKIAQAFDKTG